MDTYQTTVADNAVITSGIDPVASTPFLVLGGALPALEGISCRTTPGSPCAGILMLGPLIPT